MTTSDITLIVCTKDRPKDMKTLLESIEKQTRLPKHIIVVDGSDEPIKHVLDNFPSLSIEYTTVHPPSLPKQRNVGISMLSKEATWVGFLDDDLVLEKNSIENIEKCIEESKTKKELVAIAMIIINATYPKYSLWRNLFLLDGKDGGSFTKSGCPIMYRDTDSNVEVEWVSGGVTFWKKKALIEYKFDEWFEGTGYLEDIDYSYRVSRNYSLMSCGKARCYHYHHPTPKSKYTTLGTWQLTSWWYFANKMKFPKTAVFYSLIGLTINNLIMGFLDYKSHRWHKFLGNLIGLQKILSKKALIKATWHK